MCFAGWRCLHWCRNLGRRTLLCLVFALVIATFVLTSYVLSGGKQDHTFHFFPSKLKEQNLSFKKSQEYKQDKTDQTIMTNITTPHLQTSSSGHGLLWVSRRIPDIEDLRQFEPHIFSIIPQEFLQFSRNPCWYQEYKGERDPYSNNAYLLYAKRFRTIFEEMRQSFWKRLQAIGGHHYRLRCLPYFYIIGQPKCGTTDLYNRLLVHPSVRFSAIKEPQWWTRKRVGILRQKETPKSRFPLENYLDLFDLAAQEIQGLHSEMKKEDGNIDSPIIGEASASTMWDNDAWIYIYDNVTNTEPPHLTLDFIHVLQPNAKFIVMLRDPVERLYSDYLYFSIANKSVEDFHDKVNDSVQMFESCLRTSPLRSCVYNTTLNNLLPLLSTWELTSAKSVKYFTM
ncbi:hypothetical protein GDO86_010398 [Hymenochirus boettgeri]|uniref:Carbohydrate sulfotransferase 15 n=1 Tax=Hymenochirus boettgeri TaxID=247094 RepID=A0A8T2JSV1_9PIPI|nr:hypothetical protein GDO86_010398 [Hymenochirus boettgeri]